MNSDDIPTEITKLAYSDPTGASMSQNRAARMLAHYWPAIEAHIREQVAQQITSASLARLEEIDEDDRRPSHWEWHQQWCDAADTARRP